MKVVKRFVLALLLSIAVIALLVWINPQYAANHDTPFVALQGETEAAAPAERDIVQRIVLYGDAGHSTIEPWQASMAKVARRASISPDKTLVVALGDNIYMQGYPQKEQDQAQWDEEQLESISFLESQLLVARESGATMFLVPGNHDWYASEVDSQARHIAEYASANALALAFRPHQLGQPPLPESLDFPGVSLVFVDSEWLIQNDAATTAIAYSALDTELSRIRRERPENLIITVQHHPLETMGQHGGYMTHFVYWFFINLIDLFVDMNQDIGHPDYDRYVSSVNTVLDKYDRVIHAAGHEHSLQLFGPTAPKTRRYNLVSGAANSNKVSGVWHNENTRFALSQEGFMELAVTAGGVYLRVFDIHHEEPVAGFWLEL